MPAPTQDNRLVALSTPLGKDVLLVRHCTVREEMSRLFEITLDLFSSKTDIEFDDIIAQNVTLRVQLEDGERFYNGHVSRFVQINAERGFSRYRATVVPWLWFLTRTSDCRIFQKSMDQPPDEMTVPGIIKKVFKDLGFEDFRDDGLSESYRTWEFCVQYRETAFNFVSRLMEQEGITYFFEHEDGKHTLVLSDSINAHQKFPGYEEIPYHPITQGGTDKEAVTDWVIEREVQPGTYSLNDYNFETPKKSLQRGLVVASTVSRTHEKSDYEIYDYPGEFLEHDEGENVAKVRIEELQARHESLHGQTTALGLAAGYTYDMVDHPRDDQNRQYLTTAVTYEFDNGDYGTAGQGSGDGDFSGAFRAIDAAIPFRPARITPKPIIHGVQTAIVVGPSGEEIHTDAHGRVKVHFHWDRYDSGDENSSCWIRVSQSNAGKGWGSMITPRIGQEVIIEYLEGDPDRPIITGRVYNADQKPPYGAASGVTSGLKSNTHKGSGYNEMSLDDTAGKEKMTIHGQYDQSTTVGHDQANTIGNNRTTDVAVDDKETVGSNQKISIGANRELSVGGNSKTSVTGKEETTIGGKSSLTVGGKRTEMIGGSHTVINPKMSITSASSYMLVAGSKLTGSSPKVNLLAGSQFLANSGGKMDMKSSAKMTQQSGAAMNVKSGAALKMQSSSAMSMKSGAALKADASGALSLKAGGAINQKGSVIKLNSPTKIKGTTLTVD
jgi:type VI secretion system secreted protein VgrG